jgi:hypothetical protein
VAVTTTATTAQIADQAADLIRARGWVHGGSRMSAGPDGASGLCVASAVSVAAGGPVDPDPDTFPRAGADVLEWLTGYYGTSVGVLLDTAGTWNNRQRNMTQVIAALRRTAAAYARGDGRG